MRKTVLGLLLPFHLGDDVRYGLSMGLAGQRLGDKNGHLQHCCWLNPGQELDDMEEHVKSGEGSAVTLRSPTSRISWRRASKLEKAARGAGKPADCGLGRPGKPRREEDGKEGDRQHCVFSWSIRKKGVLGFDELGSLTNPPTQHLH